MKYIHRRNSTSKMPGVKVISKSMTNERVFYGNIPKKFKNSYIDKEGKWKYVEALQLNDNVLSADGFDDGGHNRGKSSFRNGNLGKIF